MSRRVTGTNHGKAEKGESLVAKVARGLRLKRYASCNALRARFQVERQSDFVTLIAVHHPPRARENRTADNTDQEIASRIGSVLASA